MGSIEGTSVGRRVVLGMLAAGVGGVLFGSKAATVLERVVAPLSLRDGTGLLSLFPVGRFRFYSVTGPVPRKSEADYRLSVGGSVATPLTLTLADLRALPATRLTEDFVCVTGWRVHDVSGRACGWPTCWTGPAWPSRPEACCSGRSTGSTPRR